MKRLVYLLFPALYIRDLLRIWHLRRIIRRHMPAALAGGRRSVEADACNRWIRELHTLERGA